MPLVQRFRTLGRDSHPLGRVSLVFRGDPHRQSLSVNLIAARDILHSHLYKVEVHARVFILPRCVGTLGVRRCR